MRADELQHGERIRHPFNDWVVEVDRTTLGVTYTRVYFRYGRASGSFKVSPHAELEDCT